MINKIVLPHLLNKEKESNCNDHIQCYCFNKYLIIIVLVKFIIFCFTDVQVTVSLLNIPECSLLSTLNLFIL